MRYMPMPTPDETRTIAIIDDKELLYHLCTEKGSLDESYRDNFDYIGQGYIHSVNGKVQNYERTDKNKKHFWIRNKNHFLYGVDTSFVW